MFTGCIYGYPATLFQVAMMSTLLNFGWDKMETDRYGTDDRNITGWFEISHEQLVVETRPTS